MKPGKFIKNIKKYETDDLKRTYHQLMGLVPIAINCKDEYSDQLFKVMDAIDSELESRGIKR